MSQQLRHLNGFAGGSSRHQPESQPIVLITGGAGFIGTNVAERLLSSGYRVAILDNLSRPGVDQNARWLQQRHGGRMRFLVGDIRKPDQVRRALEGVTHVFHFAAQVAVTTSIADPLADFETNAAGTLILLEEMRRLPAPPSIIYTSTNKVYGGLQDIELERGVTRYRPADPELAAAGVSEARPLDFHTPYGCSKGTAEQYVLDYSRSFGFSAVVFRMSCIYGPHQFGTEDQGWVAHFLIRAIEDKMVTIYGDGMQVRDVLYVEDLVDAFLLAWRDISRLSGQAFNIGGGPNRTLSLLELIELIASITGRRPRLRFDSTRTGDQRYYVSNLAKFREATAWAPAVGPSEGVNRLHRWLLSSRVYAPAEIVAS